MKKIIVSSCILLTAAIVMIGCERHIESTDPVRSLGEPPPVPENVQAQLGNSSVTLTWQVSDPSSVMKYRVYTAQSSSTSFALRDSTADTTVTLDGLVPNREYAFAVSSVSTANVEGERSTPLVATVSLLSIQINGGDEFTRSRNVTVRVNANSSVTHIRLSEDPTLADASFVLFSGTQTSFTIDSPGDGRKTVYAELQFDDGAGTAEPLTDSITLDTKAEIRSVSFANPAALFTAGDTIDFSLDAGESGGTASVSFNGSPTITLSDDDEDGVYSGEWVVPSNFNVTGTLVTGRFTDAAGNGPVTASVDNLLSISSPPLPVTVSALALSSFEIKLTWSEATTTDFAAYAVYRGTSAAVDDTGVPLRTITTKTIRTMTDSTLQDDTEYFYRVYVVTGGGLSAGSAAASATTFANSAPDPVELIGSVSGGSVQLNWTASGEDDFDSYRIYESTGPGVTTSDNLVALQQNQSSTSTSFSRASNTYYYRLFVRDKHGVETGSNEVSVTVP